MNNKIMVLKQISKGNDNGCAGCVFNGRNGCGLDRLKSLAGINLPCDVEINVRHQFCNHCGSIAPAICNRERKIWQLVAIESV